METNAHRAGVAGLVSISEMSRRFGVSYRTLRFYEEMALLKPVRIGSHRFFTKRDEIKLELILVGKRFGFSLRELDLLMITYDKQTNEPLEFPSLLSRGKIEQKIDKLETQKGFVDEALTELRAEYARRTVHALEPKTGSQKRC